MEGDPRHGQKAAMLLSTVGAAVAGVGFGALFNALIDQFAIAVLVVGLLAHAVGMVSNQRVAISDDYRRAWWETVAYWGCWILIILLTAYVLWQLL